MPTDIERTLDVTVFIAVAQKRVYSKRTLIERVSLVLA